MKPTVCIIGKDALPWSVDADRQAVASLLKEAGVAISDSPLRASHIVCVYYDLLLSPRYYWLALLGRISGKKIAAVISNDISAYPKKVGRLNRLLSAYIVPSKRIEDWLSSRTSLPVHHIPFFVDPEAFRPADTDRKDLCSELRIDYKELEGKLVIGSFQRDSLGGDLSKPKWQKNPDLLVSILAKLPKDSFVLLLAGPRRHYLVGKCREQGIPYVFYGDSSPFENGSDDMDRNVTPGTTIARLYKLCDICLLTSKSEGGPKQVLEGALSRTLVLSTAVGLAADILHPDLIFADDKPEEAAARIIAFMKDPKSAESYLDHNQQTALKAMDRSRLAAAYLEVIKGKS